MSGAERGGPTRYSCGVTLRFSVCAVASLVLSSGCGLLLDTDPATGDDGGGGDDGGVTRVDDARPRSDAETRDGEARGDGSAIDAGLPVRASRCGGPETLRDDFEDDAVDPLWIPFIDTAGDLRENGGRLEVEPGADTVAYAGYISHFAVDLRDSWFSVRVLQVAGDATGLITFMRVLTLDGSEAWTIAHENGVLRLIAPGVSEVTVPYDSGGDRWWRIREGGAEVHFETSPDGLLWTTHHTVPATEGIVAVQMSLGAGTYAPVASPGRAELDDVNLDPPGGGRTPFCPASSFTDDFERDTLGPRWAVADAECLVLSGGEVQFTDTLSSCRLFTTTAYDLTADSTYAHIAPIADPDTTLSFEFDVEDRTFQRARAWLANGSITLDAGTGSTTGTLPADIAYWKLEDLGDRLGLYVSSDATTWSMSGGVPHPLDLSAVRIALEMTLPTTRLGDTVVVPGYGVP